MNPAERRLIAYAAAAHGTVHIMELTYPWLITRIEADFGIGSVVTGGLATVFGWAFGSSAIPAGLLTDRLGSRRVLIYAFMGAAVLAVLAVLIDWRAAFFFVAGLAVLLALIMATTRLPIRGEAETIQTEAAPEPKSHGRPAGSHFLVPLLVVYAAFVLSGVV